MAGLRLDSRAALLKGGDNGAVVDLGKPAASKLIKAVEHHDGLAMPPDRKLSNEQIASLLAWLKLGAPWPDPVAEAAKDFAARFAAAKKEHSSFQPLAAVPVQSGEHLIDALVELRLQKAGLNHSPQADRRTLIRRAKFDLHGLPPTSDEVAEFVNDPSPDAYAKLIDRLLESPHYGERWARHWLDAARYADTKGYVFGESPEYPFAWTYRDWVVRSLNKDLPYDQFIQQQIAADQFPLGEDRSSLAALGFLSLGRWLLNNEQDRIDDNLDVVFRTTMGLSVSCARCHDHKYDPIPTADYYSLYGLFVGGAKAEVHIPRSPAEAEAYQSYATELAARERAVATYLAQCRVRLVDPVRTRTAEYLLAAQAALRAAEGQPAASNPQLDPPLHPFFVQRWQNYLATSKASPHRVFGPWHSFAALTADNFASESSTLSGKFAANQDAAAPLNPLVAKLFAAGPPASLEELSRRYAELLGRMDQLWQRELKEASDDGLPPPAAFAQPAREELRLLMYGDAAPANVGDGELRTQVLGFEEQENAAALEKAIADYKSSALPLATVWQDGGDPGDPFVFLRGNAATPGAQVPRAFLSIIAGEQRTPIPHASGRLELAKAITHPANPLTARVIVNRVWKHHFGAGLVGTPSDFGARGEAPTHPELLDALAVRFIAEGWSLKSLHRLMMTSRTYQQASGNDPENHRIDPENRLLWRMNRRGLEFEALRDSLLAVGGSLDETVGGRPFNLIAEPGNKRRTLYARIDRLDLPGEWRTFDVADPDMHQANRHSTIVPQQALYLLNSPLAADQSRSIVKSLDGKSIAEAPQRVQWLYHRLLGRAPTDRETDLGVKFVQRVAEPASARPGGASAWSYGWGSLDAQTGRVTAFNPLPHFTGTQYQGGVALPDPTAGWALLHASGGHPGGDLNHVVIRRWTAPAAGAIAITGVVRHDSVAGGDGIRAQIISDKQGVLSSHVLAGEVKESATAMERVEIAAGETIDFVVDCQGNENSDSYSWSVALDWLGEQVPDQPKKWDQVADFSGPETSASLSPWARYVQALLMSNEFFFID